MKRCTKCGASKPSEAFEGRRRQCRSCRAACRREHYNKVKDRLNAERRAQYAEDPEPRKKLAREWALANPGEAKARWVAYRIANPEVRTAQVRRYRERKKFVAALCAVDAIQEAFSEDN